jgi:putative drug exporter of the RND superfamily
MPKVLASIGRFSARHRLIVVGLWIAILAALAGVLITASGSSADEATVSVTETPATRALDIVNDEFPDLTSTEGDSLQLVVQARGDALVTDPAQQAEIRDLIQSASKVTAVDAVTDPFDPARPFVSEDQSTAIATIQFGDLSDDQAHAAYDQISKVAADAPSDLHVVVGGELFAAEVPAFGGGELVGLVIALLVLVLTFGSMLAAGANMLVAIVGVVVGTIGILAYGALNPIQDSTLTLANMLGLAVGIDYSLFILTRFRSELRSGHGVEDAVARAVGTAGTAVVFAGLTVIIALAGLSVVGISSITEMGIAGAFGVLVAVLMALTLLPVLLRTLGRRVLPRRERHLRTNAVVHDAGTGTGKQGFLHRWVTFVVRRPLVSIVGAVVVLLVVAAPMLSMKTAANVPGGMDPASAERSAYDLVVDEFGGIQSPLIVLVQGDDAADRLESVRMSLSKLDGAQQVVPGAVNSAGDAALLTVIPEGGPIDDSTKELVQEIRAHAEDFASVELQVTGETAIGLDQDAALRQALITYLFVVVALSLVLLVIMFRSLLVPLMATLGFLLSVGAAFGTSVAVFQWGWLDAIIPAPQGDPMLSVLPIILVGVLFGLAMDYQVFLVSRIQEVHAQGKAPRVAIVEGFTRSAPVVVAGAAIMAFVFAGFASSEMAVAASIALGLTAGVIADAFIVRMILMPALLSLLGRSAWWLPKWLDRVVPRIDTEGHTLDEEDAAPPASAPTERDVELTPVG